MNNMLKALILCACVLAINCGLAQEGNSTLTNLQQQFKTQIESSNDKSGSDGPLGLINRLFKFFAQEKNQVENVEATVNSTVKSRNKRQNYGGGFGAPYGGAPQGGYGGPQGGYGGQQGGYGGPQGGYGGQQGGYGGPQGGYGGPQGGYGGPQGPAYPDVYPDGFDAFYTDEFLYDYYDWVCSETNCQLCNILTAECCDPAVNVNCFLPDSCLNNPCLSGGTCIPTRTIDNQFPDFICACLPGFTGKYCQLTNEFLLPPLEALIPPPPPDNGYGGGYGGQQGGYGGPQGGYGGQQGGYGGPQGGYGGAPQPQPNYGRPPAYAPPQQAAPAYAPPQPAPYAAPPQRAPAYAPPQPAPYAAPPQRGPAPAPYSAPAPPAPAPQRSSGSGYAQVNTLSAKSTNWEGFDCNCQGRGTCAQVGIDDSNSEPEFFCICNDNTYGSRCDEGFRNPCLDSTLKARFAPIDRQIPGNYFIECRTNLPYIRKCIDGKRFNPKTGQCQTVKQRPRPIFPQGQ